MADVIFFFAFCSLTVFLLLLFLTSPSTRRLPRRSAVDYRRLSDYRGPGGCDNE